MNYEEFRDKLAEDLQEALYERGFDDVSIKFNDTTKANVSYEAMTVTPAGSNIGISLNTEAFFEEYDKGMDFSEVLSRVTEVATAALDQMPEVNVSELTDYEQIVKQHFTAKHNVNLLLSLMTW